MDFWGRNGFPVRVLSTNVNPGLEKRRKVGSLGVCPWGAVRSRGRPLGDHWERESRASEGIPGHRGGVFQGRRRGLDFPCHRGGDETHIAPSEPLVAEQFPGHGPDLGERGQRPREADPSYPCSGLRAPRFHATERRARVGLEPEAPGLCGMRLLLVLPRKHRRLPLLPDNPGLWGPEYSFATEVLVGILHVLPAKSAVSALEGPGGRDDTNPAFPAPSVPL